MRKVPYERMKKNKVRNQSWYAIGLNQFNMVKEYGLTEDTIYLDIGCGNLRGGIHVIANIKSGNYYAINGREKDYSRIIKELGVKDKEITVKINRNFDLFPIKFDMIMSWSLFTHLTDKQIELCIKNTSKVMHDKTIWLATRGITRNGVSYGKVHGNNFTYPVSFFESLAKKHGLHMKNIKHPLNRGNQTLIIFKKEK
jgi:cyclopropane fatty-acyl-phospholipid synthase-like methyltransferase